MAHLGSRVTVSGARDSDSPRREGLSRPRHKRKEKAIKAQEGRLRYVLGHDIFMEWVDALCTKALIGRLEYCSMGEKDWIDWETTHWKPLLTYVPTISLLAQGWLVLVFLEAEPATLVLDSLWKIGKGSLVLNQWHVAFDPLRERVFKRHMWVILSALPFPLWSKGLLEGIANTIGIFVVLEDDI